MVEALGLDLFLGYKRDLEVGMIPGIIRVWMADLGFYRYRHTVTLSILPLSRMRTPADLWWYRLEKTVITLPPISSRNPSTTSWPRMIPFSALPSRKAVVASVPKQKAPSPCRLGTTFS